MDSSELISNIEALDDQIDDLEEVLEPLLSCSLTESASKLPLLDKAQLYVLVTYAIESILFSYLRLNGVNAKQHPVFRELTRVKQYFEKIKNAEAAGESLTPTAQLDKAAADRFIKHGLAGNDKHDQRLEKQLEERKRALQKKIAALKAKKGLDQASADQIQQRKLAASTKAQAMAKKRRLEAGSGDDSDESESSSGSGDSSSESSGSVHGATVVVGPSEASSADTRGKSGKLLDTSSLRKRTMF